MPEGIETILFDVGGTLRSSLESHESVKRENVRKIGELVFAGAAPGDLAELLRSRARAYRDWSRETKVELSEPELWTRWLLPDQPAEPIREMAVQLHVLWRAATAVRQVLPQTKDVLVRLFRNGYRLGIVSNTSSSVEVPTLLKELEITGLFEIVVLSCVVGIRKPSPGILLEATRRMKVDPASCVYVGDRHDRDVLAARQAGFAKVILIRGVDAMVRQEPDIDSVTADHYIDDLRELPELFPPIQRSLFTQPQYNASFSTMWARHNFPHLSDFFQAASRLGFARVELNHQFDSARLQNVDLRAETVSSVHEPCPADVSTDELKQRDWLVSSLDEDCRRRGVAAIQRSIDLAAQLHLPVVVVHPGMTSTDYSLEQRLKKLYEAGKAGAEEYAAVKREMMAVRARLAQACMPMVRKSLCELLDYAARFGVRLGWENRYHYFDIPGLDEMEELLALGDADHLGFVYDVGHAQHLDRLGFYAHEDWLRRYSSRIIETHLHDVKGLTDHQAPGLGDVDFDMVARYLPKNAIRTLELQPSNTPEQVRAGLAYLAAHGCI